MDFKLHSRVFPVHQNQSAVRVKVKVRVRIRVKIKVKVRVRIRVKVRFRVRGQGDVASSILTEWFCFSEPTTRYLVSELLPLDLLQRALPPPGPEDTPTQVSCVKQEVRSEFQTCCWILTGNHRPIRCRSFSPEGPEASDWLMPP